MPHRHDEILLDKTAYWIASRGRCYGPFDYQWSHDLRGIELTYQGKKFGEICSKEELFADLAEFQLPISICEVATLTAGTLALGISQGNCTDMRVSSLVESLNEHGFGRFRVRPVSEGEELGSR